MKAELLSDRLPLCELGEGPHWDARNGLLYWVDIEGRAVHRYDPVAQTHQILQTPSMVGFAVPAQQGQIVAGLQDGLYLIDFDSAAARPLAKPAGLPAYNRFNDGKCDPRGRLWCGTMNLHPDKSSPTGNLYQLRQGEMVEREQEIYISNGLGWSPDHKTMYYTDTVRHVIWQYDYDIDTGLASNRRVFVEKPGPGRPDGLCVDSAGRVLTALWPGWGIDIHNPDGSLAGHIEVPVPQVSSCAFGGADLKTLYITTARAYMSPEALAQAPLSGAVFAIEMDIPGLPEHPFQPE
jgi:sugar lactone lactonase YvrE